MRILVTGASGLIGSVLVPFLEERGHTVQRFVRREPGSGAEVFWDPEAGRIDASAVEGADAVVHLAGKNLADGRWTPALKKQFLASRVQGTHLVAMAAAKAKNPPRAVLSASAIGYYGHCGNARIAEQAPAGDDFLARLCADWEAASQPAAEAGVRVARLRIGIVLSPGGGALAQMLPVFRLGLGGPLGSGRQFMSWIHIRDIAGAILHIIETPSVQGPVNLVSPNPVTNLELTRALGRALRRPALLPAPAPALRLAFGEMADAALLSSARVFPEKLLQSGYEFAFTDLDAALRDLLPRG